MKIETKLVALGHAPESFEGIVNMPPCRASTLLFRTLADFEAGERGEYKFPTYGRDGNPTQTALINALAEIDGADNAIVFQSGMSAIAAGIMSFVKAGDHLLMVDNVYSPTRRFCDYELTKFNVEVTYYDPTIGAGIEKLIKPNTRLIYLESPGSLTFEVQDIDAIVKVAHKHNCIVFSDNTWVTSLYFNPWKHGIDVAMQSATKYISGGSDMLMGVLTCKKEHYKALHLTARNLGSSPSPDNCYLALRGLRSMAVRMERHQQSALKVAKWLKERKDVVEVYYPALPGAPGHDLWKKYYTGACSLFSVQVKPCTHKGLAAFIDGLELFGMGFSWGGFESLIIPCNLGKTRVATKWPHEGPLLRLHIGLEHPDDLIAELDAAFKRMWNA